ncbi:hypothetical protein GXM_00284 [Nostoc sphaeroides CCNUC1]|uniref:Uncharacterized protein n=1 Tax=Nostoc sphaeroides CCNUC1 TaxID=2653204 RepID=A0A5P8VR95_9NOSO|nr:hypothetical protein GXM_00284 [Nostoc sphaeroides CCNUC1]
MDAELSILIFGCPQANLSLSNFCTHEWTASCTHSRENKLKDKSYDFVF